MKKYLKFTALYLAALMLITVFTVAVLAESSDPSGSPITEESGTEPSLSESSDAAVSETTPSEDSSEPVSSEPSEDSSEPVSSEPSEDSSEPVSSEPSEDSSEPVSSEPVSSEPSEDSSEPDEPVSSEPSEETSLKLNVETKNILGYTVSVNGKKIDLSSESLYNGDEVTVTFNTEGGFLPNRAELTVNGVSITMYNNTYTFTILKDTNISLVYNVVLVEFILNGPGTYKLMDQEDELMEITNPNAGTYSEKVLLDTRTTYRLTLTPAFGYELHDIVLISSSDKVLQGDVYHFRFGSAGTVTANLVPATTPVEPTEHLVSVNVGSGGKVTAGSQTVSGGSDADIKVEAGGNLEIVITPDEGYEIDVFIVGGATVQAVDNKYTVESITDDIRIQVIFKTEDEGDVEGIGIGDIDWNAENISVDVKDGKKVLLEVFNKIAELTPADGKYVEFVSENGIIYVPYGGVSVGSSSAINMSVSAVASGDIFNSIKTAMDSANAGNVQHKIYSLNVNLVLPEGTMVAFKLGSDYVDSSIVPVLFNNTGGTFSRKLAVGETVSVSSEGVTDKIPYANESVMICAKEYFVKHTIESAALTSGGNISPVGLSEIADGESVTYKISANEGFVIKQVLIDGQVLPNVTEIGQYEYAFENVTSAHTIKVEFTIKAVAPAVSSEAPAEEEPDGSNNTVIVALIIGFVAVLGAAALFIVKWRQEKF